MNPSIQAICFDIGGTLRFTLKPGGSVPSFIHTLQAFIGDQTPPEVCFHRLREREQSYRRWSRKTLVELSEDELWSQFMLPELPADFVRANAATLNKIWRDYTSKQLLPDAIDTIATLAGRGYALGIISNTTSPSEAPRLLAEHGIAGYFSAMVLSSAFGKRKPHPSLFFAACRQMGVPPENCAFIGDSLARDMVGARMAGFGEVGIIHVQAYEKEDFDPDDEAAVDTITEMKPDFRIGRLSELLDRYPQRNHRERKSTPSPVVIPTLYDAALSTMWSVGQDMPFGQTFAEGREAGFVKFELNHQIPPDLYRQWDANRYYISTVHDPCPAEKTADELKREDILISSLDETRRIRGVDILKRTIDLAVRLGARSVVVHPGTIMGDRWRDRRLRELYQRGLRESHEYRTLLSDLVAHRASLAAPHLDQVVKSLGEIIAFARESGVALGLENRYRYYDIPLADEMDTLLALCDEDWYGFQYDVGHAQVLDTLGLAPHDEWLQRFSRRMIGAHLHDVTGLTDHQAPGIGQVDFRKISAYLPETALITLEVGPQASLEQLARGLEFLAECGCVKRIG
jgi:HAD superfamily hydrolase (TIGR01549 family)